MSMLKFTNTNNQRAGDPLYINSDCIIAVYENHLQGGSLRTIIYGGHGSPIEWNVEESLNEVIKIINGETK